MGPFGSDIKVDNFISEGVPVLNGSNLTGFKLIEDGFKYVSPEKAKTFKKAIAKRGDIVITHRGTLGQISYIPDDSKYHEYVISQSQFRVALNRKMVDPTFFVYFFHTSEGQKRLLANKCHVGVPALAQATTNFKLVEIPLPDLDTQKQIASVISSLESKIALNNRINAELEAMAKTIYDYWFVQFDFPFDFALGKPSAEGKPYKSSGGKMVWNEELKREVPEGWEVDIIDNVIDVKDGTHDSPKAKSEGFRLITSKNLLPSGLDFESANFISEEDYININKRSKVDTGDILFSMIGSIGVVYKVEDEEINFAVKNVALYKTSQKQEYKNYIYQYLKSYDMANYMGNVISGSIQKFISLGSLRNMPLLINDDVILKYQKATEHLFLQLENNKKQNQQLSSLRDWLLPMLMNGQVIPLAQPLTSASGRTGSKGEQEMEEWNGMMAAEPKIKYGSRNE